MSNRTLIEFNHDIIPCGYDTKIAWAAALIAYLKSGDKDMLPSGVTLRGMRHHSEPEPIILEQSEALHNFVEQAQYICQMGTPRPCDIDELRRRGKAAFPRGAKDLPAPAVTHSHPLTHQRHAEPHEDCLECHEAGRFDAQAREALRGGQLEIAPAKKGGK